MRILVDVVHPAHVHFFRHLRAELLSAGHQVWFVGRDKDVTGQLLERFEIDHVSTGPARTRSGWAQASELVDRVLTLRREIERFRPDLVLTRNPAGVQAARISGVPGIFDTDDGRAAGVHFWAAFPFAQTITTPACLQDDFGPRHRRYPGYKALAYLHPDRFLPDPHIRSQLGVAPDESLFVVRFSAYSASHDHGIRRITARTKRTLLDRLAARGTVIVSDEGRAVGGFDSLQRTVGVERMHDLLWAADLCVGDSQTVAAEAAVLGTPSIHISGFSGRIDYLNALERRYGLIRSFHPSREEAFLDCVDRSTRTLPRLRETAAEGRSRLLNDSVDVTGWYFELVHELASAT